MDNCLIAAVCQRVIINIESALMSIHLSKALGSVANFGYLGAILKLNCSEFVKLQRHHLLNYLLYF